VARSLARRGLRTLICLKAVYEDEAVYYSDDVEDGDDKEGVKEVNDDDQRTTRVDRGRDVRTVS
jgi:hypothetical protein